MTRRLGSRAAKLVLASVAFFLMSRSALGQDSSLAQAREYFQAGAQAYALGEYETAIQAFEQAYQLVPRPAVLFSMAQAERKQYFLDHRPEHLTRAIALYKQYLAQESQPARKSDAVQSLSELEPLASKTLPTDLGPKTESLVVQPVPAPTRMMVTAQASDAVISLDNQAPVHAPLIREVEPGEHVVHASAGGYADAERKVVAVKGALVTVDIVQTELPAKLVIDARDGAVLSIDGRIQGECPFPKPIELAAGSHLITLTLSGYVGYSHEQVLARGKTAVIKAPMARTLQRTSALIMLGAAASAVTTGVVIGYFALDQESSARSFLDARGHQELTATELAQYNSNKDDRNRLRSGALVSFGLGAGLAMGGALLVALDHNNAEAPVGLGTRSLAKRSEPLPLFARPLFGPGFAGFDAAWVF